MHKTNVFFLKIKTNVNNHIYDIFLFFLLLNKIGYNGDSKKHIFDSNFYVNIFYNYFRFY